jgi:hypothetical protein
MRAEGVGDGAGELEGGDDVSLDGGDSREVVEKPGGGVEGALHHAVIRKP